MRPPCEGDGIIIYANVSSGFGSGCDAAAELGRRGG